MDLILLGFAISVLIAARFQKLDADYISSQNMFPVRGLMATHGNCHYPTSYVRAN